MPTAKAQYKGGGAGVRITDFSDSLRGKVRDFFPDGNAESDPVFGHPADAFVAHILSEAWWAKSELHWQSFECTKPEIHAEHNDLLKQLCDVHDKLRRLSPDYDRLLGVDADPLGCADKIKQLIGHIEHAERHIEKIPKGRRPVEKQHDVAVEMAIRVLRVLTSYGIAPAATSDADCGYRSEAVQILTLIGNDIHLVRSEQTWRDIIRSAKKAVDDLR